MVARSAVSVCSWLALALARSSLGLGGIKNMIITHFISGEGVFISLPMGSGKPLCYCLLPVMQQHMFPWLCGQCAMDETTCFRLICGCVPYN